MCGKMNFFRKCMVIVSCLVLFQAFGSKKTGKDDNIDITKYKGNKVIVGTETGSGNFREETIILHSGQVYSHNKVNKEYKYEKTLKKSEVRHIFAMLGRAPITSFNHPGTSSSFIEGYSRDKVTYYYIWGEQGVTVPGYILEDYTEILKMVR